MTTEKCESAYEEELKKLKSKSAVSNSVNTTAKYIALSDKLVKELLIDRITKGSNISRINVLTTKEESALVVIQISDKGRITFDEEELTILVDLKAGRVMKMSPGNVGNIDPKLIEPLPLYLPSRAPSVVIPLEKIAKAIARDKSFLENLGINIDDISAPSLPTSTTTETLFGTDSLSGTPEQADDTASDSVSGDVID
ncbi:MAG: hypothetical protein AAFY91_12040 [Bacteroidota bacterium]